MAENWRVVSRDPRCDHDDALLIANHQGYEMCMNCLRLYYPFEYDWLTGAEDRRRESQAGMGG